MPGLGELENKVTILEDRVDQLTIENQRLRKWVKEAMKWSKNMEPLPPEPEEDQ